MSTIKFVKFQNFSLIVKFIQFVRNNYGPTDRPTDRQTNEEMRLATSLYQHVLTLY